MKYPNLNAELARRGMSADDLAKIAKVSRATAFNWLNGTTSPSIDLAFTISKALGSDINYLFATEPITA